MTVLLPWLLIHHLSALTPGHTSKCVLQNDFEPGLMANGDYVIGGIFPLHYNQEMPDLNCTYKPGAFRWALTMKLAVEEINKRADLLPNYSLGYKIIDSCAYPLTSQRSVVAVLNGPNGENSPMCEGAGPLLAIIGESGSAESIVISYFSSCACLSDRQEFPTFFRVIPSDAYQVKAIAKLLLHFKWTWVGVVRGDHEYGRFALQGLLKELEGTGICVAYQEMIPLLYERQRALEIIRVMNHSTARVVVGFSAEGELTPFLRDYMEQNVTGIQWIASEAWVIASVFSGTEYYPFLGGTIGFGIRQGQIPGLRQYLTTVNPEKYPSNPLVHELWGTLYGCSPSSFSLNNHLPSCTGKETLRVQHSAYFNTSSPRISYNVYKGVYAIAYSLHNLIHCTPGKGPFSNSTCANLRSVYPWQLQQYLQEVSFTISGETVKFDMKGDSILSYDLINWQRGSAGNIEFVNVGMFDAILIYVCDIYIYSIYTLFSQVPVSVCNNNCAPGFRTAAHRGQPLCCFDCVPCESGKISNQTDCMPCPEDYWSNANGTVCVPKVVEFLSHDAMGITLTVIAVVGAFLTVTVLLIFLYNRGTPIVRVNNSELSFFILLSLTLCFLCALVFIGEPTSWSCMLRHTAFSITFSLCISCILGKTLVVLYFPTWKQYNEMVGPLTVIICTSKIILDCCVGSDLAFWCVLGYIGLLACVCFFLAFLARKLPGNLNEAKYITFSMLIFCAVWLAFVPAYVSQPGKFTTAVEIFAILASSFGLLLYLFAPKCYIILLKPEKNTNKQSACINSYMLKLTYTALH
uniref:G-protein coupled receptors family 3 profile domain-containing protein n=1 Tax=Sinocyclocheilus grahami TaxID=75366 RepID=A0A672K3W0_SINGR